MSNKTQTIPELDRKGLREFGLTTGAMIAALFGLLFPWLLDLSFPRWPWGLFAVLAGLGLAAPSLLRPIYRGWMRFGLLMSRIMTPLVLGIVFFGMLLPMGVIMRKFRDDPMARKLDREMESYRVKSERAPRENLVCALSSK